MLLSSVNGPVPPVGLGVNSAGQLVETIGIVAALIAVAVASFRLSRRHHTAVPWMIVIGTLVAGFMEPIYDVGTNLWYLKPHQVSAFSSFGIALPLWVLLSYTACYGGLGLLVWWLLARGASGRQLWATAGIMWIGFILLEFCNIGLGTYRYWGPQPFRVLRFPIWVSLANAAVCISLGVVMWAGSRYLPGAKQWLLVVASPVMIAGGLLGTTYPADLALHSDDPSRLLLYGAAVAANILALALIALAVAAFEAMQRVGGSSSALQRNEHPSGPARIDPADGRRTASSGASPATL